MLEFDSLWLRTRLRQLTIRLPNELYQLLSLEFSFLLVVNLPFSYKKSEQMVPTMGTLLPSVRHSVFASFLSEFTHVVVPSLQSFQTCSTHDTAPLRIRGRVARTLSLFILIREGHRPQSSTLASCMHHVRGFTVKPQRLPCSLTMTFFIDLIVNSSVPHEP